MDFHLVTDGSGHVDGFGGWAGEVQTGCRRRAEKHYIFGSSAGTGNVFRMEMTALISSLNFIFDKWNFWQGDVLRSLRVNPLTVEWINDNQALVNSVYRDPTTKRHANDRRFAPDLWEQLQWYEQFVVINAMHVPREDDRMKSVDWYASTNRRIAKEMAEAAPFEQVVNSNDPT